MNALATTPYASPTDPALLGWPPILPIEIALKVAPIQKIFTAHNLDQNDYFRLKSDPVFIEVVQGYVDMLKKEGMSFKLKAMIQSEELLKTSWEIIHGPATPAAVKADLIKNTWKVAGLDASLDQKNGGGAGNNNAFQINIHLT